MTELSTQTRTELAHRSSGGVDVTLLWVQGHDTDETVVCVCDKREGAYFEIPTQPPGALEAYYHPFAYRNMSTVDYADSRLAASSMVELGAYRWRSDAERAQATLAAAGIPTVLAVDDAYASELTRGARLLVDETDAEEANAVLSMHPCANRYEQR